MKCSSKCKVSPTQVSVVSSGRSLLKVGGVVKVLNDCFILPGHGGDVVHNVTINVFGHHAKHTDLLH